MGKLYLEAFISVAAALAGVPAAAQQRAPDGRVVDFYGDPAVPNISGVWLGNAVGVPGKPADPNRGPADGRPETYWYPYPVPFTSEYQKVWDQRVEAARSGRALGDSSARCLPFGMPRMLVSKFYPDEIVQTPGQTTFFMNSTMPVTIWTDGRGHPADLKPSFNGHSIGYWVGDTLFVDTVGINDVGVLDSFRTPKSSAIHLKWSITRAAPDILHMFLTVYDEKAYTEPLVTAMVWKRKNEAEWAILDDSSCFENNATVGTETKVEEGYFKF